MQKSEESKNSALCPRCGKEPARVHPLYGNLLGLKCRQEDANLRQPMHAPEFYAQTMETRVNQQRDAHEGDLLPPYDHNGKPNPDFAKAFPEKAKELYQEYERVTGQEGKV